jgi:hypothetical protein
MALSAFNEQTTGQITGQFVDQLGVGVPATSLVSLKLTLTDKNSGTVINNRNAQNILNASNVTVDSSGNFVWTVLPADNIIIDDTLTVETHVALFQATWGTTGGLNFAIEIQVRNLSRIS